MDSKSYWEERQVNKYLAGEKKVNDYYKELERAFKLAKREIRIVITDFYSRYAKENRLSYSQAQIKLNKAEIGDLQAFIDKVNENMGEYDQELNNMSIKARITRYQALVKQIDAILQQLYAINYQYKGEELLKDVYSDSYYRTWYNIDVYQGFHAEFAQIDPVTVEELIKYPFDGANFSTRIWKQKDHMLQALSESMTIMLIQGRNPNTLAPSFAKRFGTKEYEAYRLLHTESSFIIEQANQRAYKESGVEQYEWLATLDSKTCEECRPMDGKVFDVGEGVTGLSLTPKHSFCRCTTAPYYEDAEVGTRVARNEETGKSDKVSADMTYEQWHATHIA
jgi:SPP1 gp7 family putative phage head morphogenesis protein